MNLSQLTARRPILFVIGSAEIGGAEKQMTKLAQELRARGANVEVAFTHSGGPLTADLDEFKIPWKVFSIRLDRNRFGTLLAMLQLSLHLIRRRPILVNSWQPDSTVFVLPLVRLFLPGALRVASVRGNPLSNTGKFGIVYKRILRVSDRVILNASHLGEFVIEILGVNPHRTEVIPNGVVIPESRSDVSIQPPTAVVIANFHPYKGHMLLLEALTKVSAPVRVRLCGIGSMRTEVDQVIVSNGLSSVVSIVDSPADVTSELRDAQFAIHPSTTEGLSNAILEEFASGLPVIAFNIEGNLPLITHGENGFLVEESNVALLADAIDQVASDIHLRTRLAIGARASAERYSWENSASRYEKTFSELIERAKIKN